MLPKKYTTHCWEQGYSVVWKNPRKGLANKSQNEEENPPSFPDLPSFSFSSSSVGSKRGGTSDRVGSENWPSPLCSSAESTLALSAFPDLFCLPLVLEQPNHQTPDCLGNEGLALST